jgi:hypothetical protein
MKRKLALSSLLVAVLLPACTSTNTAWRDNAKSSRYANNSVGEPAPPATGPGADIPAQGPADINTNPAYMPTPLLRGSAASGP